MLRKRLISKGLIYLGLLIFLINPSPVLGEYQPLKLSIENIQDTEGIIDYTVQKGETLCSISNRFNSEVELIVALNGIDNPNLIYEGQHILLPKALELIHHVEKGEKLAEIADMYGVLPQQILLANDIWDSDKLTEGSVLEIPEIKAYVAITNSDRFVNIASRKNFLLMQKPTSGIITSYFGKRREEFHTGVDFAADTGTPIYASLQGRVVYVGWKGNYGNTVIIDHLNGFRTLYGHNSKTLVKKGQFVKEKQPIALMGNTGRSTGPHLHFEVQKAGYPVNPLDYLQR